MYRRGASSACHFKLTHYLSIEVWRTALAVCYNDLIMVLKLSITSEAEAELKAKAASAGVDVATYAARQLERIVAPPKSLRQISGPAYDEFLASGMTDDDLGELLEQAKHDMRAERRQRRQGQRTSNSRRQAS